MTFITFSKPVRTAITHEIKCQDNSKVLVLGWKESVQMVSGMSDVTNSWNLATVTSTRSAWIFQTGVITVIGQNHCNIISRHFVCIKLANQFASGLITFANDLVEICTPPAESTQRVQIYLLLYFKSNCTLFVLWTKVIDFPQEFDEFHFENPQWPVISYDCSKLFVNIYDVIFLKQWQNIDITVTLWL